MAHLAVSAIGRDRPGIVAAVSKVLLDHSCNLEDSQMAILRGHFTMMLVISAPDGTDLAALRGALEDVRDRLGLEAIALNEVGETDPADEPLASHMVSVYGADHPGIVHAVSSALAERDVSITDLSTRLVGEQSGEPIYAMMLEIAPPAGADIGELEKALAAVASGQEVDVTVRAIERDIL